ncbi:MAG: TolC family protein [Caulobacter sp.]|nr:TolC family protein [Caulobacter sp.]
MHKRFPGLRACLLLPSLLAGCAHAPPSPRQTAIAPPDRLTDSMGVRPEAPPSDWWRLYQDPDLDALVTEALVNNLDLRVASARLLEARAMLDQARGRRIPSTELTAGAGHGSTLEDQIAAAAKDGSSIRTGSRFNLGTKISWELDLFGRLRSGVTMARTEAEAVQAEEDGVRVLVAAQVTDAWLRACGFARQAEVARANVALAQRASDLAERLRAAGAGLPMDVLRAETLVAQTRADVPPLEAERHGALVELAVLTGRSPTDAPASASACRRLPSIEGALPVGDGAALLRRRPDVRAAEHRMASSAARVGVALSDLYPRIMLDGGVASSSPTIEGLDVRGNHVWRVGPLLSWSFPNTSLARARVAQARAGEAAALARFDATVLTALKEVNQAIADYDAALDRRSQLRQAAESSAQADAVTRTRRAAGAATALEALDAERADIEAQAALAVADTQVAAAQVVLFKALGGGWEDAPSAALIAPSQTASAAPSAAFAK